MSDSSFDLATRTGLPDDQLFLARQYPQSGWLSGPQISELARFWLGIHRTFRLKSVDLESQVAAVLNGKVDAPEILRPFQRGASELLSHLEHHHQIEDHNYFPQFARIEPKLLKGFELMDADHHVIHDGIHALATASNAFLAAASAAKPDQSTVERSSNELGHVLSTFRRNMLRHLDDEEDLVIPLIIDRKLG